MSNYNVIDLEKPEQIIEDHLSELLRVKARKILSEALELEMEIFMKEYQSYRLSDGRQRVVRHGYHQDREIQTGIGSISVKVPRSKDRQSTSSEERIRFSSKLIPPYLRKSKSIEALIPWLYLKGISTGGFQEALAAILGKRAAGLSSATVSRLKSSWYEDWKAWKQRDLSQSHYVYLWVDGVYCNVRMDKDKQCLLVIVGATENGDKELVALEDGYRESEQSWRELLMDLKHRGLTEAPKIAVGDGAMGFWKALKKVYPQSKEQRCWMHKTGNILNYLPKREHHKAKDRLHQIWMASSKEEAFKALKHFVDMYEAKYPKATHCLIKDQETLMAFYDFPAEHWRHLRTSNPIESTFATVKLRTAKVRGCFSRNTVLTMAFKLMESAQKNWIRLHGFKRLAKVIKGVQFVDGIPQYRIAA